MAKREGPSELGGYSGLVQPTYASPGRKLSPYEQSMLERQIEPMDDVSTIENSEMLK